MKCPKCYQSPITFREFVLGFKLEQITCNSCGIKLRRDPQSRLIWYLAIVTIVILSIFIAVSVVYLEEVREWDTWSSFLIAIAVVLCIGTLVEFLLYRSLKYITIDDAGNET